MGTTLQLPPFHLTRTQQRALLLMALCLPVLAYAGTSGTEFKAFYDFVYGAATGYLGRGLAITGGLIMLGVAAGTGKATIAILGVVLAIFGSIGPTIINAIFASATL
ncbi:MAG: hypothetical protein PHE17_17680 [Thiothrix sp.]|uniref:hypothetical protein n=1 Tax=Thiothrix sp. TaxID=1032 RepID=UPI00262E74B8|nr:hypothetical protein [Thiothrix sp.]MDD5394852.1 hypothetical protein [Thiothrix sp.]